MHATIVRPARGIHRNENHHTRAPSAYSGRGRRLYSRHRGRGAVRVEGARDRAGDERLGRRHPLARSARRRTGREEAIPRARTRPPDRDETGVDRGALRRGDANRERDCAPGPAARGGVDRSAVPIGGPGRADRRPGEDPRHRNVRPAQRVPRPVRHRVQGTPTLPRSSRNRSRPPKHWPSASSPGSGSRR